MDFSIFELVSEYIFKLTPRDLTRIYWNGARLWLDTGDGDLQLTFGPPRCVFHAIADTVPL